MQFVDAVIVGYFKCRENYNKKQKFPSNLKTRAILGKILEKQVLKEGFLPSVNMASGNNPHSHLSQPPPPPPPSQNPSWNPLQIPSYIPRQPQLAHMSNERPMVRSPLAWHTPTPPDSIYNFISANHKNLEQLNPLLPSFVRGPSPFDSMDLSVQSNRNANSPMTKGHSQGGGVGAAGSSSGASVLGMPSEYVHKQLQQQQHQQHPPQNNFPVRNLSASSTSPPGGSAVSSGGSHPGHPISTVGHPHIHQQSSAGGANAKYLNSNGNDCDLTSSTTVGGLYIRDTERINEDYAKMTNINRSCENDMQPKVMQKPVELVKDCNYTNLTNKINPTSPKKLSPSQNHHHGNQQQQQQQYGSQSHNGPHTPPMPPISPMTADNRMHQSASAGGSNMIVDYNQLHLQNNNFSHPPHYQQQQQQQHPHHHHHHHHNQQQQQPQQQQQHYQQSPQQRSPQMLRQQQQQQQPQHPQSPQVQQQHHHPQSPQMQQHQTIDTYSTSANMTAAVAAQLTSSANAQQQQQQSNKCIITPLTENSCNSLSAESPANATSNEDSVDSSGTSRKRRKRKPNKTVRMSSNESETEINESSVNAAPVGGGGISISNAASTIASSSSHALDLDLDPHHSINNSSSSSSSSSNSRSSNASMRTKSPSNVVLGSCAGAGGDIATANRIGTGNNTNTSNSLDTIKLDSNVRGIPQTMASSASSASSAAATAAVVAAFATSLARLVSTDDSEPDCTTPLVAGCGDGGVGKHSIENGKLHKSDSDEVETIDKIAEMIAKTSGGGDGDGGTNNNSNSSSSSSSSCSNSLKSVEITSSKKKPEAAVQNTNSNSNSSTSSSSASESIPSGTVVHALTAQVSLEGHDRSSSNPCSSSMKNAKQIELKKFLELPAIDEAPRVERASNSGATTSQTLSSSGELSAEKLSHDEVSKITTTTTLTKTVNQPSPAERSFEEVENKLEEMFAGIEDEPTAVSGVTASLEDPAANEVGGDLSLALALSTSGGGNAVGGSSSSSNGGNISHSNINNNNNNDNNKNPVKEIAMIIEDQCLHKSEPLSTKAAKKSTPATPPPLKSTSNSQQTTPQKRSHSSSSSSASSSPVAANSSNNQTATTDIPATAAAFSTPPKQKKARLTKQQQETTNSMVAELSFTPSSSVTEQKGEATSDATSSIEIAKQEKRTPGASASTVTATEKKSTTAMGANASGGGKVKSTSNSKGGNKSAPAAAAAADKVKKQNKQKDHQNQHRQHKEEEHQQQQQSRETSTSNDGTRYKSPYVVVKKDGSITVINAPIAEDLPEKQTKVKKGSYAPERSKIRGMHVSTLSHKYDADTADATWICVFCKRGPHKLGLGDLFGPYIITINCEEYKEVTQSLELNCSDTFVSKRMKIDMFQKNPHSLPVVPAAHSNVSNVNNKKKNKQMDATALADPLDTTASTSSSSSRGLMMQSATTTANSIDSECLYFGMSKVSDTTYEVWLHEDCAVWAPRVFLVGARVVGLEASVWASTQYQCTTCCKNGAMICCLQRGCAEKAHIPCAKLSNWNFNEAEHKIYCHKHGQADATAKTLLPVTTNS